tara:strand:+ start:226 stop:807 length:582 start_codon:yes stop_codon:yes gene_type:complete
VQDPRRSREHFERIFDDFLEGCHLNGQLFLDLGPGQWDFGVLVAKRGGRVVGFDNDPAVLELGKYKGFDAINVDLKDHKYFPKELKFDGLFCKFSINAFWFCTSQLAMSDYVDELLKLAKPNGWVWIAPWNGVPANFISDSQLSSNVQKILQWQIEAFESHGCHTKLLSDDESKYYGVHGRTANSLVFTRGIL